MKTSAVVLCGGLSRRTNGQDKLFVRLGNDLVFIHAVRAFVLSPLIDEVVVVFHPSNMERARAELDRYSFSKTIKLVPGGEERYISAKYGLQAVGAGTDLVLIHDGARPLVSQSLIARVWEKTEKYRACVPVLPVKDTIKESQNGQTVDRTLRREKLLTTQTPQGFHKAVLDEAYAQLDASVTDDAQLVESAGFTVYITEGDLYCIKITDPIDFWYVDTLFREREKNSESGSWV